MPFVPQFGAALDQLPFSRHCLKVYNMERNRFLAICRSCSICSLVNGLDIAQVAMRSTRITRGF